ncbi:unnamed protein product [Merluccius merluccius]
MAERQDNEIEEADQIYLLMKEEYRISRNVRLAWFLGKLNQVIRPTSESELLHSENELDLLSVLPKGWQPDQPPTARPCMLIPSTRAMFLARRYRFVIELDLSPSTGIVDDSAGKLIFDEVFNALSKCLAGLARPFRVPGTNQVFQPKIFITILAYSSIIGLSSHQVLVQCCQLDCTDLKQFLHHVYQQLRAVENNIAEVLQQQHEQSEGPVLSSALDGGKLDSQSHKKQGITMVSADIGLVSMVRQGILALQLLPPNSSAGIILITDGVTSVPDVAVCETLLNQLRSGTIACSFVQVGGTYSYDCSFGYVPNVELMKFISLASFGSYLASCPEVDVESMEMNSYHKALLSYSFLKTSESMFSEYFCVTQHKLFNEHLVSTSGNPALVMRRKKHTEKEVHAHLISVVSVRLREGYTIREINLTKGGSQLEVKLVLLWKHNMSIEYLAAAAWPLDPDLRITRVEVIMEGSYDILHDISCTQKKPITSPYRTSVIRRFWNTLQSINQTDQMLVHLQAFNSAPENYMIPESTKNGVPLFYIPPGSTTPVLSLQHSGSKDSSRSLFSSYWKPILSMDANFWQRWLHMHRITIILEHDMPVPKHVHTPGNNGRFSTIQCRISHSALTSLLKDWTSFVLVEGYSYIKLIYSSPELPPSSFYLVRLISKTPCMVLRLGFPIGTLAHIRNKIVDELQDQILKLRFPHRVQNVKEVTPKTKRKLLGQPSPSKSPSLPVPKLALSDRPCVVVLNKPLERLLIRYDKLPLDFQVPFIFNMDNSTHVPNTGTPLNVAASRTASSTLASLSRYFYHRRWVWAMQRNQGPIVSIQAMAHILSILSEIRLSEGFHFAASGEGIINMVLELPMKGTSLDLDKESHSCVVQYILFPPHSNATKDSFSTDDDNDTEVEAIDADVDLNLVMECWVEPQTGTVLSPTDQHHHFHDLKYQEIPQAIFPKDLSCMSTMMTFEYLSQMCQNKDQMQPIVAELHDGRGEGEFLTSEDRIVTVPFQFDLIQLLPKCQQIELFFLMFGKVDNEDANQGLSFLPNDMLLSLFHSSLEQELSDREILLADSDHMLFIQHILERERDGHIAPFSLPILKEEYLGTPDRQDTTMSFHTISSSQEVTGSTSTLQSFSNVDLVDEEPVQPGQSCSAPQWRCYAKYVSSQQILLTFLPTALTGKKPHVLTYVVMLTSSEAGTEAEGGGGVMQTNDSLLDSVDGPQADAPLSFCASRGEQSDCSPGASPGREGEGTPPDGLSLHQDSRDSRDSRRLEADTTKLQSALREKEGVQFSEPQMSDFRQTSQHRAANGGHLRCPVYVYHVSLDHLKNQLVHPHASRHSRDVFMRSLSHERSSMSSWTDFLTQPHKHKELASYCSLLQEHYHQSYVKGVYRSLQQSYNICSQDILTAMDYCEESLQEIDITSFLQTLCGHVRDFQESENLSGCCIVTESDTDLEVEYHEVGPGKSDRGEGQEDDKSLSDSNTVNQDDDDDDEDDSFSILDGDSLPEPEATLREMPPLFVHLTCSVNLKSCHGSTPIQTLPTCLAEVLSCLENAEALQMVDLNELSVTLDIFVLTLPPEIEIMADFHHNRVTGDSLSKLPMPQKLALLATMEEIRWLLEDEIVSALRRSQAISSAVLQKVADHVMRSSGRMCCQHETVPLQFVFGPEQSLEKFRQASVAQSMEEFRRTSFHGYVLNGEQDNFHYVSLSRRTKSDHAVDPHQQLDLCGIRVNARDKSRSSQASLCKVTEDKTQAGTTEADSEGEEVRSANSIKSPTSPYLLPGPSNAEQGSEPASPPKTPSTVSLSESLQSATHCYDGGSSDSESESPAVDEQEQKVILMPNFWLIVRIHLDRVEVYSHSRSLTEEKEVLEKTADLPECQNLHQMLVRKISDICRVVNQRMLLQDLHDSHGCNSLLVAESEEDIWKNDSLYRQRHANSDDYTNEENYQPRDYLAATMEFIPGYFACDVVWSTIIHIHPRLKMGPNMGVSRAMLALRSVLNSFCVVNRKNMFVYQERTTKSVFYLRLCETSQAGRYCDMDGNLYANRSLGLSRSPEITDELVKLLRKRLDETTLDIITVMLVRNCKLTPSDVEFIQPLGSPSNEVMQFSLPQYCLSILPAVAHYLRQNLLIFLHLPKYTDSNTAHHFKHYFHACSGLPDGDIYLYNKPGGQGTGGKGIACITLSFVDAQGDPLVVPAQDCTALQQRNPFEAPLQPDQFDELTAVFKINSANILSVPQMHVRFDVWEQGNISPLQLGDKLQGALRHALCDVVMELKVLPNPLCLGACSAATKGQKEESKALLSPSPETKDPRDTPRSSSSRVFRNSPSPIVLTHTPGNLPPPGSVPTPGSSTPESTTPTNKSGRRSFWEILSKPETSELVSPKTTDDIVPEKVEEGRVVRRRHKTESVKQQWSQERAVAVELEQLQRKQVSQLEEGDQGTLHPVYQFVCQPWMNFMAKLGCPSAQQCTAEIASHFLLPSVLMEIVNLVSSLANDTTVKVFEKQSCPQNTDVFVPLPLVQHSRPTSSNPRNCILIGRNFHQWHCSTDQEHSSDEERSPVLNRFTPHKGFQRFEALEPADWPGPGQTHGGVAPRQRFLFIYVQGKKVTLHCYNWSVDLGLALSRQLVQLFKWQNARAHVVHCLLNQKMGLFHHYCFSDTPSHDDSKQQEPNPFLNPAVEPDTLLRSSVPPVTSRDPGRLGSAGRSLAPLHFPSELLPFDEALRDMSTVRPFAAGEQDGPDVVTRHGNQLLEVKAAERREMEKQMKIENLFVTWQQRSAQSNMPISAVDLDILKQSSRLVHYCATPLLFDPAFRRQIQEEQFRPPAKKRHCSSDSVASGRDRSYSTDSADMMPSRLKEESWLLELSNTFLQQYIQYLQSTGFILVQVRPHSPARNVARARASMLNSMLSEGRMSFSYVKQKSEDSPKITASGTTPYHLQRALPGGIVLIELTFQGCYFCVKQYALECTRIPMGQTVNSQLSMLFTEECDKVRDLMHVHSFSYDYHLRVVHQHLVGCHMMLRQGFQLTSFLEDFISQHPDIPKFGRNHVFQGSFCVSTGMITAHQLYNYITDHASTYSMKPVRMSKAAASAHDGKKGAPSADQHEYALVALWNSSGSYKDLEGLQHYDDFDVSLLVCHNAAPFEEQLEGERHLLKLRFYVIMTSQRELFPRLTADMRRFKKLPPQLHRDPADRDPADASGGGGGGSSRAPEQGEVGGGGGGGGGGSARHGALGGARRCRRRPADPADSTADSTAASSEANASAAAAAVAGSAGGGDAQGGLLYPSALFPLLNSEVLSAERHIQASVEQAMGHCRRDTLWRRLFHGEHLVLDKLKLTKLSFGELEELLEAAVSRSIGEIDPQLDCFLTMSPSWYQSLIKVLLNRFTQSCRHFDENGIQYLAVLNHKFTDCFVLVFLDAQAGKTSLKVVFREPLPSHPQASSSPPPQMVSMYHHLESVINTACYNLWTGLL